VNKSPLFIIGNPRSGTTLLRLMLTGHSKIVIPPECGFAIWYYDKYKDWDETAINTGLLENYLQDVLRAKKIENWVIDKNSLLGFLLKNNPISYAELVSNIYVYYGKNVKTTFERWGDKNNFYLNHIDLIKKIFPSAYLIHITRDGRNVACSYKSLAGRKITSQYAPNLPMTIEEACKQWMTNINTIRSSFQHLKYENVLEIRFEDLVLEPEKTLTDVCEFIGENFEKEMLSYHQLSKKDGIEPVEFSQWKSKNKLPLIKNEISRFLEELTSEEISYFNNQARQELTWYNYL